VSVAGWLAVTGDLGGPSAPRVDALKLDLEREAPERPNEDDHALSEVTRIPANAANEPTTLFEKTG
jgi:hypothetical protein